MARMPRSDKEITPSWCFRRWEFASCFCHDVHRANQVVSLYGGTSAVAQCLPLHQTKSFDEEVDQSEHRKMDAIDHHFTLPQLMILELPKHDPVSNRSHTLCCLRRHRSAHPSLSIPGTLFRTPEQSRRESDSGCSDIEAGGIRKGTTRGVSWIFRAHLYESLY